MSSYNIAEAKAQLSDLVERAAAGEEITINKRGHPKVRLVPVEKPKKRLDIEEMRRITAGQKMWEGPGSFVEWMRDTDRF